MKPHAFLILAALSAPVLAQTNTDGLARDRARTALVIHAAAVQVIEETGRLASPATGDESALTAGLTRAMLEQPDRHRRVGDSRKLCLDTLARVQRDRVLGVISQAVAAASQQAPLPVTDVQVLAKTGATADQLAQQAIAVWKTNGVDQLFTEARRQAVDHQRRELDRQLHYPAQVALDAWLAELCGTASDPAARMPREHWGRLRDQLGQIDQDGKPHALFEENERHRQDAALRMADAIRVQYEEQVGALDAAAKRDQLPPAAITSERLADHLKERVAKAVTELTPESGAPHYAVYAVVQSNGVASARSLEELLLADYVRTNAPMEITVPQLESMMLARSATFRQSKTSQPVAVQELAAARGPSVASAYAGAAPADGVVARMSALLAADGPAGKQWRERVRTAVDAHWPEARNRVALTQVAEFFPGLGREEPLSAPQAERGCDLLQPFPTQFASLVEALRAFDPAWVAWQSQPLIEETEARVATTARDRIELACGAVEKQLALVRQLETERLAGLEKDVAADRPFRNIVKDWSDDLLARWTQAGGPGPAAYPDLFPRTLDLLNKTVRQLYDARRQEQDSEQRQVAARAGAEVTVDQTDDAPVEQRPDEFQSKSTDTETKDKQSQHEAPEPAQLKGMGAIEYIWKTEPDAVLIVRDTRWRRAQVVLLDGTQQELASATFRPDRTDDAARDIYALIEPALTRALDERKTEWAALPTGVDDPPPQLKIFLFVQSREIRHLTSLKLRHLMQQQVDAWSASQRPSASPVNLVWLVGL